MAIKPLTLVNGTLADANQVMQLFDELYSNIDSSNVASANKTGTGKFVLDTSPTIATPTLSGTVAGSPTFSGNLTFNGTNLFSTATANANRFHGSGDGYGGASTVLTISSDALASSNFNYLKCIADYNGTPTTVFAVGAGGTTSILSGAELYLDGGSNTSIRENAADQIVFKTGGSDRLSIETTTVTFGTTVDARLQATKKLYFDGGSNTSIRESSADTLSFETGGVDRMALNTTDLTLGNTQDFILKATKKLYLDGGSDTYISESSANVLAFFTNGSASFSITPNYSSVENSNNRFLLTSTSDYGFSYLANKLYVRTNGSENTYFGSSGDLHITSGYLNIDSASNYYGIDIDVSINSNILAATGIVVKPVNAGTGGAIGIEMGSMSGAGKYMFSVPQDNTDPTGGGGAATGRIPILVNGVTRYLAYY